MEKRSKLVSPAADIAWRSTHPRPVNLSSLPERTFQKVGVDICDFKNNHYFKQVDYYSRFIRFIRSGQSHLARHGERDKKTRQTGEEVGRQHQGMSRPGDRQSQRAVENREKWRTLVAKSSLVPQ